MTPYLFTVSGACIGVFMATRMQDFHAEQRALVALVLCALSTLALGWVFA